MPSEKTTTYAETDQFRDAMIHQSDISGLEIRDCWFEERLKIVDCWGRDVYLGGDFGRVVVNDVDVTAYVQSELDRIHPSRRLPRGVGAEAEQVRDGEP
jgi:hypothetical protein